MNRLTGMLCLLLVAFSAAADPSVTGITVKQRWPWNGKVDIDYTLNATTNCDVTLQATYAGCAAPIVFTNGVIAKNQVSMKPGSHHIVWDPADSGLDGEALANFMVTATAASVSSRTYLVLNLLDGSYEYAAEPPPEEEGGWTNSVYKSTKMVFRRIPAGTYTIGNSDEVIRLLEPNNYYFGLRSPVCKLRTVTISTDFYIGIFKMTSAQSDAILTDSVSSSFTGARVTYDDMRGATNETGGINWPSTGHAVKKGSFLDQMRNKMQLPTSYLIDLPTDAMWEVAARAGTVDTVTPNGGTASDSPSTISNIANRIGWTQISKAFDPTLTLGGDGKPVGLLEPTPWGLYDVCGNLSEYVLDVCTTASDVPNVPTSEVLDPVGPASVTDGSALRRIVRCSGWGSGYGWGLLTSYRYASDPTTLQSARLCIYLDTFVK